jgi:hypothetical protein
VAVQVLLWAMSVERNQWTHIYAGISGVHLGVESFDLGEGVVLERTYAHLFSPVMVAFTPPGPEGHHSAPWRPAEGGFGFDVHIQLSIPGDYSLGGKSDASDVIWWIAALLRAFRFPYLSVPVLSNHPFGAVPETEGKVHLRPLEITPRILGPADDTTTTIDREMLEWLRDRWASAGRLLYSHGTFRSVFQVLDSATIEREISSSLLALWGGLEQLFGSGRFRIASSIAAYLASPGEERLAKYKQVLKLYDARSVAAHTANEADIEPLIETYVLMRNALIQIVDEGRVPTQGDLESLLFGGSA